ncbi:MAG: hypothetical protein ACN4GZ_16000 [Acidimicrobiales bacterium]
MTAFHFTVPVGSEPRVVQNRLAEASKDPYQFVSLFTASPDYIDAEVAEGRNGVWRVRVDGPKFRSKGTTVVRAHPTGGSEIDIQIDLQGRGLLGLAGPLLGVATGKLQDEATRALQDEFGQP